MELRQENRAPALLNVVGTQAYTFSPRTPSTGIFFFCPLKAPTPCNGDTWWLQTVRLKKFRKSHTPVSQELQRGLWKQVQEETRERNCSTERRVKNLDPKRQSWGKEVRKNNEMHKGNQD